MNNSRFHLRLLPENYPRFHSILKSTGEKNLTQVRIQWNNLKKYTDLVSSLLLLQEELNGADDKTVRP